MLWLLSLSGTYLLSSSPHSLSVWSLTTQFIAAATCTAASTRHVCSSARCLDTCIWLHRNSSRCSLRHIWDLKLWLILHLSCCGHGCADSHSPVHLHVRILALQERVWLLPAGVSTSAQLRLLQDTSLLVRIDVPLERHTADIPHLPVSLKYVEWSKGGQLSEGLLRHGFASSSLYFVVPHGRHEHVLSQLIPISIIACAINVVS